MARTEVPSVVVTRRRPIIGRGGPGRVVHLRGEHDQLSVDAVSEALARVIALDGADVVVDLSEIRFMSAATVGVISRARELLQVRSRALHLRSSSPCASRVLSLCECADLLEVRQAPISSSARRASR